jgi:hypothetical protein
MHLMQRAMVVQRDCQMCQVEKHKLCALNSWRRRTVTKKSKVTQLRSLRGGFANVTIVEARAGDQSRGNTWHANSADGREVVWVALTGKQVKNGWSICGIRCGFRVCVWCLGKSCFWGVLTASLAACSFDYCKRKSTATPPEVEAAARLSRGPHTGSGLQPF